MKKENFGRRKALKLLAAGVLGIGSGRAIADSLNPMDGNEDVIKNFNLPNDIHATCFKVYQGRLFVSDAFKKRMFCFSKTGEKIWESSGGDRFAIPCDKFPLDISPEGELWVANTGKHRLEQLDTKTGKLISEWAPRKDFALRGCCNPMAFACVGNGRFATMEKGAWEFRIFDPSGAASSTVKIGRDWEKYDIAYDEEKGVVKFFDGENIKTAKT